MSSARDQVRSFFVAICLATAFFKIACQPAEAQAADESAAVVLEEVVVTANRREQDLQTVPATVQVVSGADLERLGADSFRDYINTVGGVGLTQSGSGSTKVGMRGVSNVIGNDFGVGDSSSTVGLYLNDVPIHGSGPLADLGLFDLQRVEVLKGPQGTLYGEGSMGGAIKMIMNPADPARFTSKGELAVSSTHDGGTNYEVRGAVNVPVVTDRLATRLVASYSHDDGYIDNTRTGRENINSIESLTVRGLIDWRLTDAFSTEVLLMHQKVEHDGFSETVSGAGKLQTNLVDPQFNDIAFDLAALTLKYDFGGAELVSSSSYWKNNRDWFVRGAFVGDTLNFFFSIFDAPPPVAATDGQGFTSVLDQNAFTQELRVSSTGQSVLNWTFGAFYRDAKQHSQSFDTLPDIAPINAAIAASFGFYGPDALFTSPLLFASTIDEEFKQKALYGEVDWQVTTRLELKLGLRWFDEDVGLHQVDVARNLYASLFADFGIPNPDTRALKSSDHDVIGRAGLSFKLTSDVLLYGLVGQGFRSGGPNFNGGLPGRIVPPLFKSDSLTTYELGAKTTWLDRRLIANAALFYNDWSNVQVRSTFQGLGFIDNAGAARVKGFELQLNAVPTDPIRLGLALNLQDSEVTDLGPLVANGKVGAPLPNSPRNTASAFLEMRHRAGHWGDGVARFEVEHVAKQAIELIPASGDEADFFIPAYDVGRLQVGVENPQWAAYVFVNNLWDERGITGKVRLDSFNHEERLSVMQPRTIGIRVSAKF